VRTYAEHAPCVVCVRPVLPVKGEHLSFFLARRTCGDAACRDELRSRTHLAKAAARMAAAIVEWSPGCAVTKLAQRHNVKAEKLRQRLLELGHKPKAAEPRVLEAPKARKGRGPPTDHLLLALVKTYGPRAAPAPAPAAARPTPRPAASALAPPPR
jgi:hypothetical protein